MTSFVVDRIALRNTAFTRLDCRVKLLAAMILLICVLISRHVAFPLGVMVFCAGAMLVARVPCRQVCLRLAAPVGMVAVLVVLQAVLRGTTPLWKLDLGALRLTVTKEGLHEGCIVGARAFGSMSVVVLLSMITPAHRVFHALRWLGIPQGWVEIANFMYRYLFMLLDFAVDITAAQRLRLGYQGAKRACKSMSVMIGTVVVRSIDQAQHTHEAMLLRGYRGAMPQESFAPLHLSNWVALLLGGALTFGLQRFAEARGL